jgi:hypothetical protein
LVSRTTADYADFGLILQGILCAASNVFNFSAIAFSLLVFRVVTARLLTVLLTAFSRNSFYAWADNVRVFA